MPNNLISRESLNLLMEELKTSFATKEEVQAGETGAFKGVKYANNKLSFYATSANSDSALVSVDLPKEYFLDTTKTTFVESFTWSEETYPESEDPELTGKPVLVLAIKGEDSKISYSFLDMSTLVDTYTATAGDGTATVVVSGRTIAVNVQVSSDANNALTKKTNGLFVEKVDVSTKLDKVDGTEGNLVAFGADGVITDSNVVATSVLTTADINDFSSAEIKSALGITA